MLTIVLSEDGLLKINKLCAETVYVITFDFRKTNLKIYSFASDPINVGNMKK